MPFFILLSVSLLHPDPRVDGEEAAFGRDEGVDVHLLDLLGEAEEGGEADDDVGVLTLVDTPLPASPFEDGVAAEGADHRIGLLVGEGGQAVGDVFQHLHEDPAKAAEHHVPKAVLVFRPQKQLGPFQHGLHHDPRHPWQAAHPLDLEQEVLLALDVERYPTDIALMHRPDDLGHHGVAHLAGEGQEGVGIVGGQLGDQRDVGRAKEGSRVVGAKVAARGEAVDEAAHLGDVHAVELDVGAGRAGRVEDA